MQRLNPLLFPVGLILVLLLAAATRLARLRSLPPGLLDAAAANGLLGREALGGGMSLLSAAGARSPLLAGLIALVGRIGGFDQLTPRLGAAIAGILAVCCTCLWLRRALGPGWGLAGGLLMAGSFWALLFSRVGLSPIAGALALAILLWLLGEALVRSWPAAFPWYLAAGIAAGIGFIADPTLRVMPLLLLMLIAGAAWERATRARHPHLPGTPPGDAGCRPALAVAEGQSSTRRCAGATSTAGPRLDLHGAIVVTIVAVLVALPWVVAQRGHPARLAFWAPTPGLPGIASGSFTTGLRGYGLSLARLAWPGAAEPGLNLPAGSLLGWFVAPWAALGLLALLWELRRTRRPILAVGLISGALLLLPAALSDAGHPGRLIAALPLLLALPLLGMRALVGWSARWRWRSRAVVQGVVVALIIVTLAGSVVWSLQSYFQQWAPAAATAHAFNADLVDALGAVNGLPAGEPVLLSTTGTGRDDLVRYLTENESESGARVGASSPPGVALTRFDGARVLPLWSESNGWLVIPAGTPVAPALMRTFAGQQPAQIGHDARGRETYRIYRVDSRVRQQLPLSVPTIPFNNGVVFDGYRLTPERGGRLATVLAWQVPGGSSPERVEVRLSRGNAAAPLSQATVVLPATPTGQPVYLLCLATLQAPETSQPVDFSVALRDARGRRITSPVAGSDGFVLLDRFQFQR